MQRSKSKQSDSSSPFTPDITSMMNTQAFETLSEFYATTTKSVAAVNEEISRFVAMRLKEDIEAQKAFATAETPTEAFQKYSAFVQDSFRQYVDEMTKLTKVVSEASQKNMEVMSKAQEKTSSRAAE